MRRHPRAAARIPPTSGRAFKQLARVGLLRSVEHVEHRRLLDDFTVLQHGDVVRHLADDSEVVADPDHCGAESRCSSRPGR